MGLIFKELFTNLINWYVSIRRQRHSSQIRTKHANSMSRNHNKPRRKRKSKRITQRNSMSGNRFESLLVLFCLLFRSAIQVLNCSLNDSDFCSLFSAHFYLVIWVFRMRSTLDWCMRMEFRLDGFRKLHSVIFDSFILGIKNKRNKAQKQNNT